MFVGAYGVSFTVYLGVCLDFYFVCGGGGVGVGPGGGGRLSSGIDTVSGLYIYWTPVGLGRVELIAFTADYLGWCWWGCTCITTDLDSISTYGSRPETCGWYCRLLVHYLLSL